jgi:hypothetical protein
MKKISPSYGIDKEINHLLPPLIHGARGTHSVIPRDRATPVVALQRYEHDTLSDEELIKQRGLSKQVPKKHRTTHPVLQLFPCLGLHDLVVLGCEHELLAQRRRHVLEGPVHGVGPAQRLQRQVRRLLPGDHHGAERRALLYRNHLQSQNTAGQ